MTIPQIYSPPSSFLPTHKNPVYVANYGSNTISVIDGNNYSNIKNIPVGMGPYYIISNPLTDTIYISNAMSNSVSVIDGLSNKVVAGVTLDINPINAGNIICNNLTTPTPINKYFYVFSQDRCVAKPNKGFEFQSWQENLKGNSTQMIKVSHSSATTIYDYIASFLDSAVNFLGIKSNLDSAVNFLGIKSNLDNISKFFGISSPEDEATLNIAKFGSYTANFKELPPPLPPEYLTALFSFILSTMLGTWLIPPFIRWTKSKTDIRKLNYYHKKITSLYHEGKLDEKDLASLDDLKNNISDAYVIGKINQEHYESLKIRFLCYMKKYTGKDSNY